MVHCLRIEERDMRGLFQLFATAMPLGVVPTQAFAQDSSKKTLDPLVIAREGSLYAGGIVKTETNGDTFHGDHLYAYYQIPVKPRKLPLVMWHGCLGPAWEATPDGREGYQPIFIRRGFSVYVIDEPRLGRGGRGVDGFTTSAAAGGDAHNWTGYRLGMWVPPAPSTFFPGVQFPRDPVSLDQFFRYGRSGVGGALSPFTNPEYRAIPVAATSALVDRIGPVVLVTHSNSGQYAWLTRIKNDKVKGIVAYEPATFVFPNDDPPPPVVTTDPVLASYNNPILVSPEDFAKLTTIPIQIVYGDNIDTSTTPSPISGVEVWRLVLQRVNQFVAAVNARGGHVTLLRLPEIGIHGNTHFAFWDLNNVQVADTMSDFLHEHGLDAANEEQER
jgi:hypothetical protein